MDRSQYLVQALQSLGQPAAAPPDPLVSPQQLAQIGKDRKAFEAANPGQSYMAHGFQQMGRNVMAAPGNLMAAPGNAAHGLADLARHLGVLR
jgi:hypothetical protein